MDKPDKNENDDPSEVLPDDQLYLVLVSSNGGADLEATQLTSFAQAKSMLLQVRLASITWVPSVVWLHISCATSLQSVLGWQALARCSCLSKLAPMTGWLQVALTLAVAEECLEFEHRDLHWGNLLLEKLPARCPSLSFTLRGEAFEVQSHGLRARLIDFTLSRMRHLDGGEQALCCDLDAPDRVWLFDKMPASDKSRVRSARPARNPHPHHRCKTDSHTCSQHMCSSKDTTAEATR